MSDNDYKPDANLIKKPKLKRQGNYVHTSFLQVFLQTLPIMLNYKAFIVIV